MTKLRFKKEPAICKNAPPKVDFIQVLIEIKQNYLQKNPTSATPPPKFTAATMKKTRLSPQLRLAASILRLQLRTT